MNLPKLENLHLRNSAPLSYFSGLKSLKNIYISDYSKIDRIDEGYDP